MNIIQKIKIFIPQNSDLLKNFIALGLVQITNFAIPLITFPYLVHVLSPEKFGVISYGLTILTYMITFTDYGFNLSATRLVALHQNNQVALSRVFSSVMSTKLVLLLVSLIVMAILCVFIPRFQTEAFTYLLGMLYVLGNTLVPIWFFQGIEKMKYITHINLISKLLQLLLIALVVREPGDYIWILGIYGLSNIASGVHGIHVAIKQYNIVFFKISATELLNQIREGWPIFLSNFSTIIIVNSTVFILGFFETSENIGYYSIAEKIIMAIWSILSLFSQVVYPYACRMAVVSHEKLRNFILKISIPFTIFITIICVCLYTFAPEIIIIISGGQNPTSINVLEILSVVPLIVCLNIPAYQILLAYDMKSSYSTVFYITSAVNLFVTFVLVNLYGVLGAAISMVIIQTFLTIFLHWVLEFNWKDRRLWRL